MIALSQLQKKQPPPPSEFLVRVTNVAIKSCSDPGDQLRVAACRLESTIVDPDGGHDRSSFGVREVGSAGGRVAAELMNGTNVPNWINVSVRTVTS